MLQIIKIIILFENLQCFELHMFFIFLSQKVFYDPKEIINYVVLVHNFYICITNCRICSHVHKHNKNNKL